MPGLFRCQGAGALQYTELCEPGGARFLAFNIDPDFNWCVDGLVWLELDRIKPKKRERYLNKNK